MSNPKINPEEAYRTLTIIWLALLVSQITFIGLIYAARPEVFKFDPAKPLLGESSVFVIVLAIVALTNFGLSFLMKKRSLDQAVARQEIAYLQTGLIIACAFCEAISLFGMVLAFAFSYQYFFLWFALGILGTLLHFPRRDDVLAASDKQ